MSNPLGSDSGGMKAPKQSSSKLDTSVGSGSRPGNSKFMIPTSSPMNARTLDRAPFGSEPLGGTKTSQQGSM